MGSFAGHVLPGSFFIVFGLWWWLHILALIARAQARFSKRSDSRRTNNFAFEFSFVSTTWLQVPVPCLRAFPVEPCLKAIAATVGMIAELTKADWSLLDKNGHFSHLNNFAHTTMFAIFLLAAVMEILRFYSILHLPPATEFALTSLAFFVVGGLFYFHIDGRSVLDQKLHILLYMVAFSVAIVLLLEAWHRNSVTLLMSRAILVVLLGTWFIQVAHVLYGTHPWKDTSSNRAFVVIAFTWHILGLLSVFLCSLVALSVFIRVTRSSCVISLAAKGSMARDAAELDNLMITEKGNEAQPD